METVEDSFSGGDGIVLGGGGYLFGEDARGGRVGADAALDRDGGGGGGGGEDADAEAAVLTMRRFFWCTRKKRKKKQELKAAGEC